MLQTMGVFAGSSVIMGASIAGSPILLLDSIAAGLFIVHEQRQADQARQQEVLAAASMVEEAANNGQRYGPNQQALVDLAKQAKRTGVTPEQARTLIQWANEYGVRPARGPEAHPARPFGSQPHIHLGPVDHIPVRPR
jgi:hypothetical protein